MGDPEEPFDFDREVEEERLKRGAGGTTTVVAALNAIPDGPVRSGIIKWLIAQAEVYHPPLSAGAERINARLRDLGWDREISTDALRTFVRKESSRRGLRSW